MSFQFQCRLGLGTWQMGESARSEAQEITAIASAIEMGYQLIDTAEMYGSGQAETLIGKALQRVGKSTRDHLQIVSKVLPSNASTKGTITACERSIRRMGCDYLDCYLLHWQGSYSYEATLEGFIKLQERGLIRSYGISNFDAPDVNDWLVAERNVGSPYKTVCNQAYYALNARGIEYDLIPFLQEKGMALMAYSPLGAGALMHHPQLSVLAKEAGLTPAQVALAWVLRQPNAVAIPKTVHSERLKENLYAANLVLDDALLKALDQIFAPPIQKKPLMVI
ncbi:aldo/keto reductase [Polynucleobacter sp. HIN7]|uniref:aldo/keto reductase n=1 Tax=Polynucleobacter sp. HIN7 TaxID=3047866 RepID=UPI0025730EC6|nr:aldo/keto reductase [Polynucleobacter sp. HIN7]BEI37589.1 aldo/keto reductase [Polynucleobacter sp. HIN7]